VIVNSASDLGVLVRSKRKQQGWSQQDLAMKADVSPLWISQFERGKPTAHIGLVIRTLKELDVKLWVGTGPDAVPRAKATVVNLDDLLGGKPESRDLEEKFEKVPDPPKG